MKKILATTLLALGLIFVSAESASAQYYDPYFGGSNYGYYDDYGYGYEDQFYDDEYYNFGQYDRGTFWDVLGSVFIGRSYGFNDFGYGYYDDFGYGYDEYYDDYDYYGYDDGGYYY